MLARNFYTSRPGRAISKDAQLSPLDGIPRPRIINYQNVKEEALSNTLARIGSKLIYLRKKKGYSSHEDFAYDYELPRVQYWRIEKGKANITIKSLCKLLTIHDLSVEEFFFMMYKEYKEAKKS